METIRAFIAVEAEEPGRRWLASCLEALQAAHPRVRWVRPEHLHLTLKFLGEVPARRVQAVGRVVEQAALSEEPFLLRIGEPGSFGRRLSPRTFWLGLAPGEGREALLRLHRRLEEELAREGFPAEGRDFTPHLTLGRNPRLVRAEGWEALLAAQAAGEPPAWTVGALHFYSSRLGPGGPVHRLLAQAPLGGAAAARALHPGVEAP
jgi:2'-5' RNA ligase